MTDASARLPEWTDAEIDDFCAAHRAVLENEVEVGSYRDAVRAGLQNIGAVRAGIPEGAPEHRCSKCGKYEGMDKDAYCAGHGAPPPQGSAPEGWTPEQHQGKHRCPTCGNWSNDSDLDSAMAQWKRLHAESAELAALKAWLRPQGEAPPSAHTAIDALLDEMLWIARARADTRAERDAASNEIAAHRAAIHDAVRGLRGGEAPQ